MDNYVPSDLVKFIHEFPHISFNFVWLQNPTFTFDDPEYLQSLVMVAMMPLAILALSMIGFIIYFCCVKMKRASPNKADSASCYCSVCLIIIFVMIAFGGIGIIAYSSIQIHEGINSTLVETSKLNQSFAIIINDLDTSEIVFGDLKNNLNKLDNTSFNETVIDSLKSTLSSLEVFIYDLPYRDSGIDDRMLWMMNFFQDTENYRMIVTFSLIGIQTTICLFALLGICFRSRCLLITTVLIGLLCLVISYVYIGVVFMIDVASADLCVDPYSYIQELAIDKLVIDNGTAQYYLVCSSDIALDFPFKQLFFNLSDNLLAVESIVADVDESEEAISLILDNMYTNTMTLKNIVRSLSLQLDCKPINSALSQFVSFICFSTFDGFFITSISSVCVCLSLTVILCAAPLTWKRFSRREDTEELDLDDVFLPPPARQPSVSRTNNPLYISPEGRYSTRISSNSSPPVATNTLSFFRHSEEDMTLLDQPPPEYSPGSDYP